MFIYSLFKADFQQYLKVQLFIVNGSFCIQFCEETCIAQVVFHDNWRVLYVLQFYQCAEHKQNLNHLRVLCKLELHTQAPDSHLFLCPTVGVNILSRINIKVLAVFSELGHVCTKQQNCVKPQHSEKGEAAEKQVWYILYVA